MPKIKRIGVLTSGGDAPGMNAAIRAIVLACHHFNIECIGFYHGYNGLICDESATLTGKDIDNIIGRGGTILKSARCKEMKTEIGVKQAANTLRKNNIEALIVIGGDGSFNGLLALKKHWQGQVIGLPGTIDNDLDGTDYTIGFSTAINTAIHAIDNIRDTANAFERVFVVELMGRHSGHIAFNVGIACGAEEIISFENFQEDDEHNRIAKIALEIKQSQKDKSNSFLIILAENLWHGGAASLTKQLNEISGIDSAACILGHIQRGGSPVAKDRILATKLGVESVSAIMAGEDNIMIGEKFDQLCYVSLLSSVQHQKKVSNELIASHQTIITFNTN